MSVQTRPSNRRSLLVISLLGIASMFMCGAIFLWLAWGANTEKLPTSAQTLLRPFLDNASEKVRMIVNNPSLTIVNDSIKPTDVPTQRPDTGVDNPSPNATSTTTTTDSTTSCMVGFSYDPVLKVCVENILAPQATATPDISVASETCLTGFVLDPVLNICVELTLPPVDVPGLTSAETPVPGSNECAVGLVLDPVLGVCVDANINLAPEPQLTIEVGSTLVPTEIVPPLPELPPLLPTALPTLQLFP